MAFLYVFTQFAIYRARRYRMTRTIWRGVRFWMTGSGWNYALRASLWGLADDCYELRVLSCRGAMPALERYKMQHTHYGDLQGSFEGRGGEFFKRAWWLWLLTPFAMISYVGCSRSSTRASTSPAALVAGRPAPRRRAAWS